MLASTHYCIPELDVRVHTLPCHKVKHAGVQLLLYVKDRYYTNNHLLLYPTARHYASSRVLLYPLGMHFTHCNNLTLYKLLIRSIVLTPPPSAVAHAPSTTVDSKLFRQNISKSSVIIPGLPPPFPPAMPSKH
jgi:hypothetical protein